MAIDTTDLRRLLGPSLRFVGSKLDVVVSALGLVSHAETHENGGSDEIDVTALSGVLGDDQKANKIRETSGPTLLTLGAVADGEYLVRSGSTLIGGAGAGGGGTGSPAVDISEATIFADEFDDGDPDLAVRGWTVWNETTGSLMTRVGAVQLQATGIDNTHYRSTLSGSRLLFQFKDSISVSITRAPADNTDRVYTARFGMSFGKCAVYLGITNQAPGGAQFTNDSGFEWDTAGISEDPGYYMPVRRGGTTSGSRFQALTSITAPAVDMIFLARGNAGAGFADYLNAESCMTLYDFVGAGALTTVGAFGLKLVTPAANTGVVFIDYIRVFPNTYYFNP